ncbi:MAG: hypothetical protein D3910_03185 [Candidatus Electrothrix sp. ATG2]|nr:hypothetical protein [Candidatus Electrothrix sp. ATG2]
MSSDKYKKLASKYYVDDITSALTPGGRLSNILKKLEEGKPISQYTQQYLRDNGLLALLHYHERKKLLSVDFLKNAQKEQTERRTKAQAKAVERREEKKRKEKTRLTQLKIEQERAAAKKRAFDNNPKNRAKKKQDKLRRKYDLSHFIERDFFPRVMKILRRVDSGARLSNKEVIWISTEAEEYYTEELKEAYHKNEAEFYADKFKKHKDPWAAVNASSHYRKCNEAKAADMLLETINIDKYKNVRLKSALCTTHGGAKRDLEQW